MATAIQDVAAGLRTSQSPLGATSATEIQDRFLTLLVTQLKHQDPLSPMDNSQVTTQLSQISTVTGIDKLNTTMSDLAKSMSSAMAASQSMSNVSMIGREVIAPSTRLNLTGAGATGAVQLAKAAEKVAVNVYGPAGNIVAKLDIPRPEVGLNRFTWDGKGADGARLPNGAYTFGVQASTGGKPVDTTAFVIGKVTAVGMSGTESTLIVDGGAEVKFADVRRIQ